MGNLRHEQLKKEGERAFLREHNLKNKPDPKSSRLWQDPIPPDWWNRGWPFLERYDGDLILRARDQTWSAGMEWQIVRLRPDIGEGRFDTIVSGEVVAGKSELIFDWHPPFEAMTILAKAWQGEFGRWALAAAKLPPFDYSGGLSYG